MSATPRALTRISTVKAPQAIGTYSQAIRSGNQVFISGQIALDPATGQLVQGEIKDEIHRVFENLKAIAEAAAPGGLAHAAKVVVYILDFAHFPLLNSAMTEYFTEPYPARATIAVAALPRGARIEVECILTLP